MKSHNDHTGHTLNLIFNSEKKQVNKNVQEIKQNSQQKVLAEYCNEFQSQQQQKVVDKKQKLSELIEQKRKLKGEIDQLKKEEFKLKFVKNRSKTNPFVKYQEIYQDQQKFEQAAKLIEKQNYNRKIFKQYIQNQEFKHALREKKQEEQYLKTQQEKKIKADKMKRDLIMKRMKQNKKKLEIRKKLQSKSNVLVDALNRQKLQKIKEDKLKELKQLTIKNIILNHENKKFDFEEIRKHQKQYLMNKMSRSISKYSYFKNQRYKTQPNQSKEYLKNRWTEIVQKEKQQLESYKKLKEETLRMNLEKRQKYAELVTKLFRQKHKKNLSFMNQKNQSKSKDQSKSLNLRKVYSVRQTINMREKSETDSKVISKRKYILPKLKINQARTINVLDNSNRTKKSQQTSPIKLKNLILKPKKKKSFQRIVYKNYLQTLPRHQHSKTQQWEKIFDNKQISLAQKIKKVKQNALILQSKAHEKQDYKKNLSTELYLQSIRAKMALLNEI